MAQTARLITAIRLGRFAECEARGAAGRRRARPRARPDLAYVVWIQTACALACAGDLDGRAAHRRAGGRGDPRRPGGRAALPGRARPPAVPARPPRRGGRGRRRAAGDGGAARLAAAARPGPPRRRAGRPRRRPRTARRPTCSAPRSTATRRSAARPPGWPRPRRWPSRGEPRTRPRPSCAARRWSRSGPRDQPWALVPRMARVQGLVARARGDDAGGAAAARPRRPRAGGAAGARPARRRRSTWRRWSTSAARPSSGWSSPTGSSPASWPSWRSWRSHARVHADRPGARAGRGGLEAAVRPDAASRSGGRASRPCGSAPTASTRCGPTATRTSRCRSSCAPTGRTGG